MAYKTENLNLIAAPFGAVGPRFYAYYNEDADSNATLVGGSFMTDGVTKGLRVGDVVDAVDMATPKHKRYQVASVSGKAATLAAVTAIT